MHEKIFDLANKNTTYIIGERVQEGYQVTVKEENLGHGKHRVTISLKVKNKR